MTTGFYATEIRIAGLEEQLERIRRQAAILPMLLDQVLVPLGVEDVAVHHVQGVNCRVVFECGGKQYELSGTLESLIEQVKVFNPDE